MSMFGWLKKLKKNKFPNVTVDGTAEDALESSLANPKEYITAEVCSDHSTQHKRTTITFVNGSSDSKPQRQRSSVNEQPTINIDEHSQKLKELRREVLSTQQGAPSNTPVNSSPATITRSLYPSLDLSSVNKPSTIVRERPKVKHEEKSIHDIAREIPFSIEPRILNSSQTKKKYALLNSNAQLGVQQLTKLLKRSTAFEYDFNRDFDISKNSGHVKVYKTLRTFDDVRKCHQMVDNPLECEAFYDSKTNPLFQGYYEKFRCYKGQKTDLIDCD